MGHQVIVETDGDMFASLEHERALVEFRKDGDSPNCPRSWTYGLWFDGNYITGNGEEMSLCMNVDEAVEELDSIISELSCLKEYLDAYGAFGREPE